jgi:E1A-binding protein p400
MANSQEQSGVARTTLTASSKYISSPFRKTSLILKQQTERKEKLKFLSHINTRKCSATAMYASDLIEVATINNSPKFLCHSIPFGSSVFSVGNGHLSCLLAPNFDKFRRNFWDCCHALNNLIKTPEKLVEEMSDTLTRFVCIVPRVISPQIRLHASHLPPSKKTAIEYLSSQLSYNLSDRCNVLNIPISQMRTQFPELRLIQYDCGKLQTLDKLLWELKTYGHRVLIFTQMSRMLDIFEQFLNHHGHTYLRLDGTTKIEQRQALMERFNADKRIFCFILSTRSGGIGVNLTGADTVIFYDSDWNPTMDAQAQDRCHRIGQTRDVHIYRFVLFFITYFF